MREDRPLFAFPQSQKLVVAYVKTLKGVYDVRIVRARADDNHTNAQLAYLHGVVLPHVAQGMTQAWGETVDAQKAKSLLKADFLMGSIVDRRTGEVVRQYPRSCGDLSKAELSEFIEQCIKFAAEYLGVSVPPAAHYEEAAA